MMNKRQRLSDKTKLNSPVSQRHALLISIFNLIAVLYKKSHPDKLAHFKKWEREKIVNLGLAAHSLPPTHSPTKDIAFKSWHREKITNFGLTATSIAKKIPSPVHQPKQKSADADTKLTPKISPVQNWKKDQNQNSFKNDNTIDDFFKILGYE